eukprot:PhF_6_TR6994/c0_g1_i1/m.10376
MYYGNLLPTTMEPHQFCSQSLPTTSFLRGTANTFGGGSALPPKQNGVALIPPPALVSCSVVQAVRDEHGCRYLQDVLTSCDPTVVDYIVSEILNAHAVTDIMSSKFGNYFIQKLFDVSSGSHLIAFIHELAPNFAHLSANPRGTYAVRKLVEVINTPLQADLVIRCILSNPVIMFTDTNASQVCRRLLKRLSAFPPQEVSQLMIPFLRTVCVHIIPLSSDQQGCVVVQRCFDAADPKLKEMLASAVIANADALVVDPYGNYVVQHVLEMNDEDLTVRLLSTLVPNIGPLSCNKYSSNVLEKCIGQAALDAVDLVVIDVCLTPNLLSTMLVDEFGNYVVQRLMKAVNSCTAVGHMLCESVRPLLATISAEHVRRKIETRLREMKKEQSQGGVHGVLSTSPAPTPAPAPFMMMDSYTGPFGSTTPNSTNHQQQPASTNIWSVTPTHNHNNNNTNNSRGSSPTPGMFSWHVSPIASPFTHPTPPPTTTPSASYTTPIKYNQQQQTTYNSYNNNSSNHQHQHHLVLKDLPHFMTVCGIVQ